MNHFATALQTWLDTEQPALSLRQLSNLSDLNHGDLSRIRSGAKTITTESLAKLIPAVATHYGRPAAETLLVAYLRDEIPAEFRDSITITATTSGTITLPDGPLADAIRWIHSRADLDPGFGSWIIEMHALMTTTDPPTAADTDLPAASGEDDAPLPAPVPEAFSRPALLYPLGDDIPLARVADEPGNA